jgi:HD-like signal output (HDOD) protein
MDEWKLPDQIREAILWHHEPPPIESGKPVPLACLLYAADSFVNASGHAIEAKPKEEGDLLTSIGMLGMAPDVQEQLLAQFQAEHAAIAEFYH